MTYARNGGKDRASPLSRVKESRVGCRSGAERDQSAWVGGEGEKASQAFTERARPTMVRRGPPCGAAIDARCTGARAGHAPVHRAQPADHFSCNAVRPRRAPRRPACGGRASSSQDHCRMDGGGVKEHARAAHPARPRPHRRRGDTDRTLGRRDAGARPAGRASGRAWPPHNRGARPHARRSRVRATFSR